MIRALIPKVLAATVVAVLRAASLIASIVPIVIAVFVFLLLVAALGMVLLMMMMIVPDKRHSKRIQNLMQYPEDQRRSLCLVFLSRVRGVPRSFLFL